MTDLAKPWIIVDMDGTLSDTSLRVHHIQKSPKDWDSWNAEMLTDPPKDDIVQLVQHLANSGVRVAIVTGRFERYRQITASWLALCAVPYHFMFMRQDNDYRSDHVVKKEIYDNYIKQLGRVWFVLDDRDSVVNMWRSEGLTCLQVSKGDF